MNFIPVVYLTYMFISFYFLILTLLLYFKNKNTLFDYPKMTREYSVSVIIPAYNEGETIEKTIRSVAEIDYANVSEIIVINDGSKDNTLEVAKSLMSHYKNLKIINKQNSGKADSINKAIHFCRGELIVIVDADSYPHKESFKQLVGYFDDPSIGAATGSCLVRNQNTFLEKLQAIEYRVIAFTRKLLEYIESIYVIPGTLAMYRKKALEEVGGFDSKNITEDIEMTWRLSSKGWKVRMSMGTTVTTEVPNNIKGWYTQRRRWALGGLQCINQYRSFIFRRGMFGYFIIPFFALGLFLGLFGIGIFLYLVARKSISSYLITKYSIESSVPLLTMNSFYITPSVLNYFGLILFGLFLIFTLYVLAVMKDVLFEKQSFFNLIFYMTIYLLIYPIVLVVSIWHFIMGKNIWR